MAYVNWFILLQTTVHTHILQALLNSVCGLITHSAILLLDEVVVERMITHKVHSHGGLYLWEGERGIPTFLIRILPLQREREGGRGRGGVRGRGRRERGREWERKGKRRRGGVCLVYVAVGSSTSFHFRCVYTYAKITHTYVRLHSCVALHLALSMNAATNFCSPINNFKNFANGGGGHSFTLPEREGEGGRREGDGE